MMDKSLNTQCHIAQLRITRSWSLPAGLQLAVQTPKRCASLLILDRCICIGVVRSIRWRLLIVVTVFTALLSACTSDVIPINSTLILTPETHTTIIVERQNEEGRCLYFPDNYVDIPILMQLTTGDGSPIGDAILSVYADFAANTYSENAVLGLYDDYNGNGVVDTETELVSGHTDDIARVKTDTWTGSRYLLLRVNLSCAFRGEIFAFTGGVSGRAAIEVVASGQDN